MKKLVLLLIIPFFFISLYAVDPADATVQLNLATDKFNIGFASTEENAKKFTSSSGPFVLETSIADNTLVTTASGEFYLFYNAVIGTATQYKLYLQINNPLLHTSHASEENPTYEDSEYIPYSITVEEGSAGWKWDGASKLTISDTGVSISSPASPKTAASKKAIETNLRGSSALFNVSGYAKVTASVTNDIKGKAKGSYESTIKLIVSTT